jgi:hypothetical protein
MATSKAVGSLYIDIEARTAKLEEQLARANGKLDKFGSSTGRISKMLSTATSSLDPGKMARFAVSTAAAAFGLSSIASALSDISKNADAYQKLGIISPQAYGSIKRFNEYLYESKKVGTGWLAEASGFLADGVTAGAIKIGDVINKMSEGKDLFDALKDFGDTSTVPMWQDTSTPDEREAMKMGDVEQDQQRMALMLQRAEQRRAESLAEMENVEKIMELRRRAAQIDTQAAEVNKYSTNEIIVMQGQSLQLQAQANTIERGTKKEALDIAARLMELETKGARKRMSDSKQIKALETSIAKLKASGAGVGGFNFDPKNPNIQAVGLTDQQKRDSDKLLQQTEQLNGLLDVQQQKWDALGESMSDTFVNGILEGEKLGDILGNLLKQLAQYLIQQAVIAPLGKLVGGGLSSMFGGMFGIGAAAGGKTTSAVGGPLLSGRSYLVGEEGPEIFTPSSSGQMLSSQTSAGAASNSQPSVVYSPVYNIAAGVTASDLRVVLDQHEKRVRGGIMSDIARGGGRAARFGA